MKINSCAIIGGDLRYILAANHFHAMNIDTAAFGFDDASSFTPGITIAQTLKDTIANAEIVILPLPYSTTPGQINAPLTQKSIATNHVAELITPNQILFGGKLDAHIKNTLAQKAITYYDYLTREEFAILNAIPTAEGAIQIALNELPITLHQTPCLITGFGRIAKLLCHRLSALGSTVYCAARKESDRAFIEAFGCTPLHTRDITKIAPHCKLIFNTIPEILFDAHTLQSIPPEVLIIDLASNPGGIDYKAAEKLGSKVIHALSLPGKTAPKTAAEIICKTIMNITSEQEANI